MVPGGRTEVGRAGTAGTSEKSKDAQVNSGADVSHSKLIRNSNTVAETIFYGF